MKLIAQVSQPSQPTPKPTQSWLDSINPFLTPALIITFCGLMYNVLRNNKKDVLEEICRKISVSESKILTAIQENKASVEKNGLEIHRSINDIIVIKQDISDVKIYQDKITTSIKVLAKIGDEHPDTAKATIEEVLP